MDNIKSELPKMLTDHKDGLRDFKRDKYEASFRDYYSMYLPLFDSIENKYKEIEDKQSFIDELAQFFVDTAKAGEDALKKKNQKDNYVIDQNSMMAVYVLPAIMEYNGESSNTLAETIVTKWNQAFIKYTLRIGRFDDIKKGFRTKLCYVTTAVCDSLGKDENCYELKLLKKYRDEYLCNQPDGEELINEYYNIAPTIVNRINKKDNAVEIFQSIFQTYINPCIQDIEANDNEACKQTYIKMIRVLQQEYMGYHNEH